jgi:membrane-associated phospholipid phosphatase
LDSFHAKEQWKSWPSGHSVISLSEIMFISFFLNKAIKSQHHIVTIFNGILIIFGLLISSSRIIDFKHRHDDVTVGLLVAAIFEVIIWDKSKKIIFENNSDGSVQSEQSTKPSKKIE